MKQLLCCLAVAMLCSPTALAAPDYNQMILESVFPHGGQQGTSVVVELTGSEGGLKGATDILVDGAPGITVSDVTVDDKARVRATFTIARNAVPGRRMIRVKGGQAGLTGCRWFFVGPLPEHIEGKDNNTPATSEPVTLPLVVNGIIERPLDQDCFRFQAKAGDTPVVAVMSHWLDAMGRDRTNMGFSDLSLDILDANGRIVAQASDTLGYDPLIHFHVPADGEYIARVSGMGFKGFPTAIYRLTIGEVPYPIAVFPAGGQRGRETEVEFFGPNVPPETRQKITVDDDPFGVQYVSPDGPLAGIHELPFLRDDQPQQTASPQSARREEAVPVSLPVTVNGRFDTKGHGVWCRTKLSKGQTVTLSIMAQQRLRAPVDTRIEVFDEAGERVAANDDGELFGSECSHDFVTFDSRLEFTPKKDGDYFIHVTEQSGAFGVRAVFRLTMFETRPDFRIYQWPDALPVWGPGSTKAFVVETHRMGGLKEDIELSVEGLPPGWTGSTSYSLNHEYRVPQRALGQKTLLTITAPANAAPGTIAEFHVTGRATTGDREIVHRAESLTLHMWQEPNHFRLSPVSRAVVAPPQPLQFHAPVQEISARPGEKINIPIHVKALNGQLPKSLRVSVNRGLAHFKCALGPQVTASGSGPDYMVPVAVPESMKPGRYGLTVADAWSSETRSGLPGPCTPLIRLVIPEAEE